MATFERPVQHPPCPVCVAEVTNIEIEPGYEVHDPHARGGAGGTAIGSWSEVAFAAVPGADVKPAPDFSLMTLRPCGHTCRGDEEIRAYLAGAPMT